MSFKSNKLTPITLQFSSVSNDKTEQLSSPPLSPQSSPAKNYGPIPTGPNNEQYDGHTYSHHPDLVKTGLFNNHFLQIELNHIKTKTSNYVPTPKELASYSQMLQQFSIHPCSNFTLKNVTL